MLLSLQHHILYLLGSERLLVNYWVVNFLSKSPKGNNNEELPNPASHSLNSSQRFVFIFSSIREYHGKFYPDYVTICNWFNSVQPIRENFSQFVTYPNSRSVTGNKCISSCRIDESRWFLLLQFLYVLGSGRFLFNWWVVNFPKDSALRAIRMKNCQILPVIC